MIIAYNTHHIHLLSMMQSKVFNRLMAAIISLFVCVGSPDDITAQSPGNILLTGLVTDIGGAPLPGVNITVHETTTGTITDIDGRYRLEVSDKATLTFSYTGYQSLVVQVDGRTNIDVLL